LSSTGLAEDLTLARVVDGAWIILHALERGHRTPDALLLELDHLIGETHALLADAPALRHRTSSK
jgi:hypothetical protein